MTRKNAPKILAVSLLIIIAALMAVAGSGTLGTLLGDPDPVLGEQPDDQNPDDQNPDEQNPDGQNPDPENPDDQNPDGEDPDDSDPDGEDPGDETDKPDPLPSVFPKKASASERYRFEQSLTESGGAELLDVMQTAEGNFTVLRLQPSEGDINVKEPSVVLLKSDAEGTLLDAYILKQEGYLCSQITSNGISLALSDGSKTYFYTVTTDLNDSVVIELPYFRSGRIFALSQGAIFFAEGAENRIYHIRGNAVSRSTSVQSGSIVEVFDFGSRFGVVINGLDSYSYLTLNLNLECYATVTVPDRTAIKVVPVTENGEQKFIVVERGKDGISVAKHKASFLASEARRVGVGLAERASVYLNGTTIFLHLAGENSRIYLMDLNLDFTMSSAAHFKNVVDVLGCHTYRGGYLFLTRNADDGMSLIDLREDGSVMSKYIDVGGENAAFVRDNGGDTVFVTQDGVFRMYGL